jgi:bleomycin hydrolase
MRKMKNLLLALALATPVLGWSQEPSKEITTPYQFTVVKENAVVGVDNQCKTGTCWSFATMSFLESEIIRKGGKPVDLSEMINPRIIYSKKADSYVRFHGKQQFSAGGLGHDVMIAVREYGIVPESAFTGFVNGETEYNHRALDVTLEAVVKSVLESKLYENGNGWKNSVEGILDGAIGKLPTEFTYEGKKYTPASFRDALKINPDDYVNLTSFTHHPFYTQFVLEVPDNWAKGSFYNLPLDELQQVMDNAIDNGFTVGWDADVSERGFSFKQGAAILPTDEVTKDELWTKIVPEKSVTQEERQKEFDNFKTTDDHLMHITGKAKDQNGTMYYIMKNSWGEGNMYKGYQYVSRNYFQMKTVSLMVHKDAIPKDIKKKLGIS